LGRTAVLLTWADVANGTGYRIQRNTNAAFAANLVTSTVGPNVTTFSPAEGGAHRAVAADSLQH